MKRSVRTNRWSNFLRAGIMGFAGILFQAGQADAATITAASCELSAVQSAVNSAVDGDTVNVPVGTCTWSSALNITNKTIILKGAGAVASGGTRINYGGSGHTLVSISAGSKKGKMDVSGFYFFGGDSNYWNGTAMQLYGPDGWKNLRVHHNVFDNNNPWTIKGSSSTHGLIDHNTFRGSASGIMLYGNGASDWASPLTLGTADFFFVEDNNFDWNDFYGSTGSPTMDMDSGGRQVFRNNRIKHGMWETHDKARSGLVSANAFEIYNNTFDGGTTNKWKGIDVSAGTGVIWGNTFTGDYTFPIGAMDYKSFDPRSVRLCDGTDPADKNVPGESGWICQYQIGSMGEGPTAYQYPLYLWGNKENGTSVGMQCTDGCNHVKSGRDFINSASAKAGYVPYQYPHPLQAGGTPTTPPPTNPVLVAPSNLRVVSVAYNQVKLQFDDSNTAESGFQVLRRTGSSGTQSQIATTTAQSYDDNSVAASTQYCYQVKAYDSSSSSAASNEICATTSAAPVQAPVISSMSANPANITAGQSSTLSFSVSGATSLVLNPGNINVTGTSSRVVTPSASTTYTLTATNSGGSASRSVTVTVGSTPPPANVGPSVSITSPSNGSSFSTGMSIAINANASDNDGSISKVEFFNGSVKLGEDLTAPYSLTMSNVAAGSYSLIARATDNAGAIANSAAVSITVNAVTQPPAPPTGTSVSLLTSQVPALLNMNDGVSYELGMRFTSTVSGKITAIRFFKGSSESGTRTGKIYSSSGAVLASVTFSTLTTSGWQQMNLATPLSIAANTEYTVSVNTGAGYYVATNDGFASQISNGSLRSVVGNNGVYGPVGSRPTNSFESSNYFRDIVFVADSGTTTPPPPSGDVSAPVASIISPVNGSQVTHSTTVAIQASASDDVGVVKVEFYVNGNLKCTDSVAPYSCNWAVSRRIGRTHQLQVKAYDASGKVGNSAIVSVTSK